MELSILHVHQRRVPGDVPAVSSALDSLWSGGVRDAFPWDFIKPLRRLAPGSARLGVGSQFGHGPFSFTVVGRDDRSLVAQIDTYGMRGAHSFSLLPGGGQVMLTHTLRAELDVSHWIVWKTLVGSIHDWAVAALLERLEYLLVHGRAPAQTQTSPPSSLRLYSAFRRVARARKNTRGPQRQWEGAPASEASAADHVPKRSC